MKWNQIQEHVQPDPNLHRGTVAGVTFIKGYPENLRLIQQALSYNPEGVCVSLTRNPDNKYDTNAVEFRVDGQMIGHVPKQLAAELAPLLDSGSEVETRITSIGGANNDPTKLGVGFSVRIL